MLGKCQADRATHHFLREPRQADLSQQHQRLGRGGGIDARLGLVVGKLLAARDECPFDAGLAEFAVGGHRDGPHQRRPCTTREKARGILADCRWVERRATIGRVQRDPPCERLGGHWRVEADESGNVGDRVVHPIARRCAFGVIRLVEVGAARRIDRDERDLGRVDAVGLRFETTCRNVGRRCEDHRVEAIRDMELVAYGLQPFGYCGIGQCIDETG